MSSEEKQLLFGEYAAGRISAADKRRLMAAALEDQELFDAIAEQEELNELTVSLPAAPPKRKIWPFLMTAAATGAVTLGLFLMLRPKPEPVLEMAKVIPPPQEMAAPPAVSAPAPAPAAERKRTPTAAPVPMAEPPMGAAAPVTAPAAPAPAQELAAAPELERQAKKAEMPAPQVATMAAPPPAPYQILHRDPEGPAQMVDGEPLIVRYRTAQAGRFALVDTGSGRELAAGTAVAGATIDLPFTAVRGEMNLEVRRAEVAFAAGRLADRAESRAAAPAAAPKAAPARGPEAPVRISLTIR